MNVRIATVGHVDHGKSTLIGRLLAETGQTQEDRKAKVADYCATAGRKFEYAFLLDALEEEQAQGITLDVTEVTWTFEGRRYVFVDTPGHREFLKKMVGGASRVDAALLLLDVTEGVQANLRRQIQMLELLGVREQIVLLNKMDLVDWSEKAWRERQQEVLELFAASPQPPVILPMAAWHGANLLRPSDDMPWFHGPTLAQVLSNLQPKRSSGLPRFLVQDSYRLGDRRIYVGRVESGAFRADEDITFFPGNVRTKIRSIETYGKVLSRAEAGAAVGLTFEDPIDLERGALGFPPEQTPLKTDSAIADLFWLATQPLRIGDRLTLKSGTRSHQVRVGALQHELDCDSFVKTKVPNCIRQFGRVTFNFDAPFAFDRFDDCEATGRFVVCHEGQVLGGGRWIEAGTTPARAGRVLWLTGLSGAGKSTLAEALERDLKETGQSAVVLDGDRLRLGLCRDLGFSETDREENVRRAAEVAKLLAEQGTTVIAAFISPSERMRALAREIVGAERFQLVFVDAPLEVCRQRDVKGLYQKAKDGELTGLSGVDAPFEPPQNPDLHLPTDRLATSEAIRLLSEFVSIHMPGKTP